MRRRSEVKPESIPEAARETAQQLKDELQPPPKHIEFDSANRSPPDELSPDIQRIVETQFVEKPFEEYQKLETKLRGLGSEQRSDHGSVNRALDEAEGNARLAFRLMITMKAERRRWESANDVIFGAMRTEATRILQSEKSSGLRNKMITDLDVESMCATKFGEEWKAQQTGRRRVELAERSMENMSELWNSRCRSLQAMLAKIR